MKIHAIDPLADARWAELVSRHPDASVFHTHGWLKSLKDTYGYRSVVFTTSDSGRPLENGVVLCEVRSWLTGMRLVSLPFADFCQPLVHDADELGQLMAGIRTRYPLGHWRYIEFRPLRAEIFAGQKGVNQSAEYCWHGIDIRDDPDELFRRFNKSSICHRVRRAEREGVLVERGRDARLLIDFYRLALSTRRRHRLPPQPLKWFESLIRNFGDDLEIRVARWQERAVAAILTLRFRNTTTQKYSCSDETWNSLGGTPLLMWGAIRSAHEQGSAVFDLGRSELDNVGLLTFKDRWRAERAPLSYYRIGQSGAPTGGHSLSGEVARRVFAALPDSCLAAAGRALYRHVG